jgi:hypothetical protein
MIRADLDFTAFGDQTGQDFFSDLTVPCDSARR